jgi:hypothetical protein
MTNNYLSTCSWKALSAQDKRDRKLVIEVLRKLRNGENFSQVKTEIGISKNLVRIHAFPIITEDELNG